MDGLRKNNNDALNKVYVSIKTFKKKDPNHFAKNNLTKNPEEQNNIFIV